MEVLHLCSYYYGSKLYENLIRELDENGLHQKVYIPIMKGVDCKVGNFNNCEFLVKETYSSLDRLFFTKKFKQNYRELIQNIDVADTDIVHAHTLFTNGVIAYELKKKYNIPYIVAVRNSDVNTFFKYFIHLRSLGVNILKNAEKVIFISPAYLNDTIQKYVPEEHKESIRNKSLVIPNGVNEYWINNLYTPKTKPLDGKIKLVYAGEITTNKNIHNIINDVVDMNSKGMKVHYDIVGYGAFQEEIENIIIHNDLRDTVKMHGRIEDKDKLRDIFRDSDVFVMTSTYETFGLSYIEALSQGLPVLYTKGQGIDGFFEEGEVGYSVELGNSIEEKLNLIIDNYDKISARCVEIPADFKWEAIAKNYVDIYKAINK